MGNNMKLPVYLQTQVEVDVSSEDIVNALLELDSPEIEEQALHLLNTCCGLIMTIPDSLISEMKAEHLDIISSVLTIQAQRFHK